MRLTTLQNLPAKLFYVADLAAGHARGARCPSCGSGQRRLLCRKAALIDHVYACQGCGIFFRATGLQSAALARWYYSTLYMKQGLEELSSPLPREEVGAWARRQGKDRTHLVKALLGSLTEPPPWIAVIGATWGYEMILLEAFGIPVWGVEVGEDRRRLGVETYGLSIYPSVAEGVRAHGTGGVVVSSHVLEHIPALDAFLTDLEDRARPLAQLHITPRVDPWSSRYARSIGREHPLGVSVDFWSRRAERHGQTGRFACHKPAGSRAHVELLTLLSAPGAALTPEFPDCEPL